MTNIASIRRPSQQEIVLFHDPVNSLVVGLGQTISNKCSIYYGAGAAVAITWPLSDQRTDALKNLLVAELRQFGASLLGERRFFSKALAEMSFFFRVQSGQPRSLTQRNILRFVDCADLSAENASFAIRTFSSGLDSLRLSVPMIISVLRPVVITVLKLPIWQWGWYLFEGVTLHHGERNWVRKGEPELGIRASRWSGGYNCERRFRGKYPLIE